MTTKRKTRKPHSTLWFRDKRIAALEADLADAHARIAAQQAAASDVGEQIASLLDHFPAPSSFYGGPPIRLLTVERRYRKETRVSLCVAAGGSVLPYEYAESSDGVAAAVQKLTEQLSPEGKIANGFAAGLRALHGHHRYYAEDT
jgi:hypothetical protein